MALQPFAIAAWVVLAAGSGGVLFWSCFLVLLLLTVAAARAVVFAIDRYLGLPFGDMSLGTRKKFMLASGLMGGAPVLLMDEPSNGIDADAKDFLIDQVRAQQGSRLILFPSHDQALIAAVGARVLDLSAPARAA